ncbi:MAG: putative methyltransferase [Ilumatobacteraceae bacterium]|nr:putative methyltransferase [Ilumatobacteraceae bacterium]
MIRIDNPADPRVDAYRSMRARESDQVLWAEGPTVVERLFSSSLRVTSVLLSPAAHRRLEPVVAGTDADVFVVEQAIINEVVGFDLHRGAIAIADRPSPAAVDHLPPGQLARVLVLEGINDAENLGAIVRSARALGADAMILDPTCADPYYRRAVRVSMGEVFHLPMVRAPLDDVFAWLAERDFHVWALTPRPDAAAIGMLHVPDRLALVVGAEGHGLSDRVLNGHRNVRIPVRSDVDSLNVGHAVAAALAVVQSSAHER